MNTSTENTKNIVLSPAEEALITLQREQAAIAKKEKAIKKKISDEKKIEEAKQRIAKFLENKSIHANAVKNFFEEFEKNFPGLYVIKETEQSEPFIEYNYLSEEDAKELGLTGNKEYIFDEKVPYKNLTISRKDQPKFYIEVKEQFARSGSRFSGRNVSKGFKMYVHGCDYSYSNKALIKVSTAHDAIQYVIDVEIRKNSQENNDMIGWDMLLEYVKKNNPDATEVKKEDRYISSQYGSGGNKKLVVAIFPNGFSVDYSSRYYNDNDKGMVFVPAIAGINYGKLKMSDVVAALKTVKAKE